jgi:hypothetical protein
MKNIFFLLLITQFFTTTASQNLPSDITPTSSESSYSSTLDGSTQVDENDIVYTFTGNILNTSLDNEIPNIAIRLLSNHQQIEQTLSDSNGWFEFIGIPSSEQLCEVLFTLPSNVANVYSGRIANSYQEPFANIPIDVVFPNGEELHLTTSSQGEYSFRWGTPIMPAFLFHLPGGDYRIRIHMEA